MQAFQVPRERNILLKHIGGISQIAGARRYRLSDGACAGVEAVEIRTGSGFTFTVLPGRGMDIAWAEYRGIPLSFLSQTGVTAPQYYDSGGSGWLRSFFGGLLTTCGLLNVGPPCEGHGLHGRISNTAAENVCVSDGWDEDGYTVTVSGRLREASMFGENLTLTRTITAKLGESRFTLEDTVENHAFTPSPLMLLYHFNLGYPLLDEGCELVCQSNVTPRDETAAKGVREYAKVDAPRAGRPEEVFFHDMQAGEVSLVNRKLGLTAYLRYNPRELPCFTQWKQLGEGEYVLGLEPGSCNPVSQTRSREDGTLDILQAGEKRCFHIEFGVMEGPP